MFYFIVGLFWGSLINNIAYRLVRNQNFISGSSKCDYCQKKLNWYELIPVISYIIQKGKCRGCGKKISLRYPLTEIFTGLFTYKIAEKTFLLSNFSLINFIFFLYFLLITSLIFIITLYDLETFYIEEKIIYFAIFAWLIFILIFGYFNNFPKIDFTDNLNYLIYLPQLTTKDYALNRLYFSFIFALAVIILFILTLGKGIGLGDSKILFILGLYFNFGDLLLSLLVTIFIGGLFSFFILLKNRKLKQTIPFGPFIFIGLFITILLGEELTEMLFSKFLI
ncbi:MAG: prepilin peptidase [Patescibacteria group bacterium]|nr:prepilin peptidase [Patescibacteria group bacterium]